MVLARRGVVATTSLAVVDADSPLLQLQAVHGFLGGSRSFDRVVSDESKAARALGLAVLDNQALVDLAVRREGFFEVAGGGVHGQPKDAEDRRWLWLN